MTITQKEIAQSAAISLFNKKEAAFANGETEKGLKLQADYDRLVSDQDSWCEAGKSK